LLQPRIGESLADPSLFGLLLRVGWREKGRVAASGKSDGDGQQLAGEQCVAMRSISGSGVAAEARSFLASRDDVIVEIGEQNR
jgi:hypothetical protein